MSPTFTPQLPCFFLPSVHPFFEVQASGPFSPRFIFPALDVNLARTRLAFFQVDPQLIPRAHSFTVLWDCELFPPSPHCPHFFFPVPPPTFFLFLLEPARRFLWKSRPLASNNSGSLTYFMSSCNPRPSFPSLRYFSVILSPWKLIVPSKCGWFPPQILQFLSTFFGCVLFLLSRVYPLLRYDPFSLCIFPLLLPPLLQ